MSQRLPSIPNAPGGRVLKTASTSPPPDTALGIREGWDANFFASTDTLPTTGRITRRYRFNDAMDRPLARRLPKISHFDVRIVDHLTEESLADPAGRFEVPSQRDYLRVYYSDFLSQPPVEQVDRPKFVDSSETTIESEELQDWVMRVRSYTHARARTQAHTQTARLGHAGE